MAMDKVVDSKRVTPARRRDADKAEGSWGDVAAIAAAVHGTRARGAKSLLHAILEKPRGNPATSVCESALVTPAAIAVLDGWRFRILTNVPDKLWV